MIYHRKDILESLFETIICKELLLQKGLRGIGDITWLRLAARTGAKF